MAHSPLASSHTRPKAHPASRHVISGWQAPRSAMKNRLKVRINERMALVCHSQERDANSGCSQERSRMISRRCPSGMRNRRGNPSSLRNTSCKTSVRRQNGRTPNHPGMNRVHSLEACNNLRRRCCRKSHQMGTLRSFRIRLRFVEHIRCSIRREL